MAVESKAYGTVLIKAKAIMDILLTARTGLTLKEISTQLASPKSTTLKILNTMEMLNLVWRGSLDKQYHLGTDLIAYGHQAFDDFDLTKVAEPYLRELRNITNETVNLGMLENNEIVFLEKFDSPQSVNLNSQIGSKLSLYSSAMGKAVLATMSGAELDSYLSNTQLRPLTQNTITSIAELRKQIALIKRNQYAVDLKENQDEVICVGASIVKHSQLFGAFSISIPEYRLDDDLLEDVKRLVVQAKKEIEKRL